MKYTITLRVENDVDRRQLHKKYSEIANDIMDAWDKLAEVLNTGEENTSSYKVDSVRILD